MISAVRQRLTYANVIATVALFLALGGGAVWAAGKIGTKKLKANSVTTSKIRANAVTGAKIKNGAVGFAKLATGANVVATASSPPVAASGAMPVDVPFTGATSFTPKVGTLYLLNVEARGNDLGRVAAPPCEPTVVPFVNGSEWDFAEGTLKVRAFAPTPERPTGLAPLSGATGPVGLTSPGVPQAVGAKVFGDPRCTPSSTVTVAVSVVQLK
jgi:hypothetical protein